MTTICHLFDESAGWEQRIGASQLIEQTRDGDTSHLAASIDAHGAEVAATLNRRVERFHRLGGLTPTVAPSVQGFLRRASVDSVYAWGLQAALAARAASNRPLVVPLFDPGLTARDVRLLRTLSRPEGFAVACASDTLRRRLIEGGVPSHNCAVIRPAVDFALIRRCRNGELRDRLRMAPHEFVVTMSPPQGMRDRAVEIYWAVEMLNSFGQEVRILVPGCSRVPRRIRRLDRTGLDSRVVVTPPGNIPFEQLVAISDVHIVIPEETTSTTSIAWAMASGSAVIATAVYAVAELIANKVNGLLFNPRSTTPLAGTVGRLLMDRDSQSKVREVARGHAYEVFSIRRYVDQHERLRRNLATGGAPCDGIVDSAVVA